jgi:hypothetical protein
MHEQLIADGVAERVVDALEMVEVKEDQRRLQALAAALLQRLRVALDDVVAVGQAGEQVVVGEVLRLGLRLLESADVGFGHQQRLPTRHGIAAQPGRHVVPPLAVGGQDTGNALVVAALDQPAHEFAQVLAVEQALLQGFVAGGHAGAGGRVAVERTAGAAVQRGHDLGVQQRLDAAQRVRCHGLVRPGLAQHGHAPVRQPHAAEAHPERRGPTTGVERPLLGKARIATLEILLVLAQPPRHRLRHVGAHVTRGQLDQRARLPQVQPGGIGPVDAAAVNVEDPDRLVQGFEQPGLVSVR